VSKKNSVSAVNPPRVIALAAGGTAGHVYPALDVAAAYLALLPNTQVLFLGVPGGMEERLVPCAGHRLIILPGSPLFGTNWPGKGRAGLDLALGTRRARRFLQDEQVQFVMGFGGYASASALLAARSLGLATAIYEPNAAPGLTNRVLSHIADRIYTTPASHPAFTGDKPVMTGVPVRPGIARVGEHRRGRNNPAGEARFLVTGGSGGSAFLNRQAPELLKVLQAQGRSLQVWHQTGDHDVAAVRDHYAAAGIAARVESYIDRAEEAYAWADFGIICAGATTLAEISAARLPSVITPLSTASERHQIANARSFAASTDLAWVSENEWHNEHLAARIELLLRNPDAYAAACQRLAACAPHDAARSIVEDCERLVSGAHSS
jgi:UDP-N-acetylglucosamine--N-acetylmuramyl-(pentapeptide) pyrophosphoryl-undecaprenol N-acetylglucosamine transferase